MEAYIIILIIVDLGLAILPANVAKRKGKDFMTWYIYGFFLWIIAMLHAISLPEQKGYNQNINNNFTNDLEESKVIGHGNLENSVDLNSPVEILRWDILSKNDGNIYLNVSFRNLNQGVISAIKLELKGYNSFNELIKIEGKDTFISYIQDLDGQLGSEFINEVPILLPKKDIRKLDISIKEVAFNNGKFIYKNEENIIERKVEYITNEDELKMLRQYVDNSICYGKEENDLWICVCGRPNYGKIQKCVRCNLDKEYVFTELNKEKILHEIEKQKRIEAKEEEERILRDKEIAEQQKKARKKNIIYISIFSTILVIVVLCSTVYSKLTKTPLTTLVREQGITKINMAIKLGNKVNEIDQNGDTPLNVAIKEKNIEVIKTLISCGADINKKDMNRKTAFDIADELEEIEIAELLVDNGSSGFKKENTKLKISDGISRDYVKDCFSNMKNNNIEVDSTAKVYYEKGKKTGKIDYYFEIDKKIYLYKGEIKNNSFNGKGVLYSKFIDSSGRFARLYDGEFKDGIFNGKGSIYWPLYRTCGDEKIQIEGIFENGNINGQYKLFKDNGVALENGICFNGIKS